MTSLAQHRDWRFIADRLDMSGRCWEWTGAKTSRGYGHFGVRIRGKQHYIKSHRAAYELASGRSPGDLEVMHTCDNPSCCNPSHLVLGKHHDNMADMKQKGRAKGHSGEKNGKASLTEDQVRQIRGHKKHYGMSKALAKRYGVTRATIWSIRAGKTWQHVTDK